MPHTDIVDSHKEFAGALRGDVLVAAAFATPAFAAAQQRQRRPAVRVTAAGFQGLA